MKQHRGMWFPDHEEHLQEWIEKVIARPDAEKFTPMLDNKMTYQYHKYAAAKKHCRHRGLAVDIGAHVGLWSRVMARDFFGVVAFEPMPEHAACWRKNMGGTHFADRLELHEVALGDRAGMANIKCRTPGSSGDTGVDPDGAIVEGGVDIEMRRLDDFNLQGVDFLKIDCEGYELFVLRGAEETLKRCHPCVIVEQKVETGMEDRYGVSPRAAVDYLISLGAKLRNGIQGDYILSWG